MFSERCHLICEQLGWKMEKNGKKICLKTTTPRKDTFFFEVSSESFISDIRAFVDSFRKSKYIHRKLTFLRGYFAPMVYLINTNRFVMDAYWLERTLKSLSDNLLCSSH